MTSGLGSMAARETGLLVLVPSDVGRSTSHPSWRGRPNRPTTTSASGPPVTQPASPRAARTWSADNSGCAEALSNTRVPDESTVPKLTRRIGSETVAELTRALIVAATREKRFRVRAVRIDSTVIEADVKYPTDAGVASARGQDARPRGPQARDID
jgi:hypothetical protein